MMDYMDEHTLRVLEFDKILQMAAAFAVTASGKTAIQKIRPLKNIEEVRKKTGLVSECLKLLSVGHPLGIEHFDDLSSLFQRARPADAVLEPFELRSFLPLFYSSINLKMLSNNSLCPCLGTIVSLLTTHPDLKKAIEFSVDREGKLTDGASPELSYIRQSIKSCEGKIKGILEGILKQKELIPHLQDFFIAERNNRWVIPVKRDSKGSVPGIVHDISNTGETVYVEPYSIQRFGNELESLRAEEKLEVYRILKMLSSLLRVHLHEIEEDHRIVAEVDKLQALAGFSKQMDMSPPEMNERGYTKIVGGRHPLLWKTLRKEKRYKDLVPLDLEIGRDHSCMVITGSNAGGKTVVLKTIGVLNLMVLSGMHIPAGSGTTIPFLENVLADIGDEQSIEQNLSTFSAHITRISKIINQSSNHTLIIIDELGTGTDPEQGGALSCSVLRRLKQRGALTVVSTHLGMLKAFAHSETGMINSAMEMEEITVNGVSTYRPTYKLIIGEAGTSHAFEIAKSLGLHEDIIREARQLVTNEGARIELLISEFKQKTRALDRKLNETEKMKQEIISLRSSLGEELSGIRLSKHETLSKALKEAEEIVRNTKREAREVMETLKKSSLAKSKEVAKNLKRKHEELKMMQKMHAPEKFRELKGIKIGQRVFINTLGINAIVHSVNEKARKCKVLVDGKEIMIPFKELSEPTEVLSEHQTSRDELPLTPKDTSIDIEIPGELNVIGQRVDPAISLIERYLNDASVAGLKQIHIIHGIGTGRLSRAVRDYLKDHPLVESSRKGNEDEGGEAVTVVFL
jgi:DNA mismatch repair protein MutS2